MPAMVLVSLRAGETFALFLIGVSALTSLRHQRRALHLRGARILSNFLTNVLPPQTSRVCSTGLELCVSLLSACFPVCLSTSSPRRTLSNLLTHVLPRRLLECARSDWPPQTSRVRAKCLEHCVSLLSAWPPLPMSWLSWARRLSFTASARL